MKPSISEYLKSLGETSTEVAINLFLQGVTGKKESCTRCPILNGIRIYCYLPWGMPFIRGGLDLTFGDDQICDPSVPWAIARLMSEFDAGLWQVLDEARTFTEEVRC